MNKVVVVGGTGLVGRAISKRLKQCTGVDFKSYGSADVNLLEPSTWQGKFDGADVLVAAAGIVNGSKTELMAVNAHGVGELSKYCDRKGVSKLILISSGAVYGDTNSHTFPGCPLNPVTDYAKSKLLGERFVKKAFKNKLNILRLYFPYGPHEDSQRLVPRFKKKILENKPITCRPDGGPFLSLMHVDDMAKVIANDFIFGDVDLCEVNLASDQIMSIRELGSVIASGLGRNVIFEETGDSVDVVSLPYHYIWRPFVFY